MVLSKLLCSTLTERLMKAKNNIEITAMVKQPTTSYVTIVQIVTTTDLSLHGANILSTATTSEANTQEQTSSQPLPSQYSSSSRYIGLAVGLPVGIFLLLLLLVVIIYSLRKKSPDQKSSLSLRSRIVSYIFPDSDHNNEYDCRKNVANHSYNTSTVNTADIARYLYEKPPAPNSNRNSSCFARPSKSIKWTYESPLSRWFLTKTIYAPESTSIKTPTVTLKPFHLLARDYSTNNITYPKSTFRNSGSAKDKATVGTTVPATEPKPTEKNGVAGQPLSAKTKTALPKLDLTLSKEKAEKILPQVPSQKHDRFVTLQYPPAKELVKKPSKDGLGTYRVIRHYDPTLADELLITPGEHVTLLATHNDGWCLVEKCHSDGSSKTRKGKPEKYINENRGVVPFVYLEQASPQ